MNQSYNNEQDDLKTYKPRRFDIDYHYELPQIVAFEKGDHLIELNDELHTGKLTQLGSFLGLKWMEQMTELEIELKAILFERVLLYKPDINTYVNKRLIPFMDQMLDKVNLDQSKLKIQCYINEIMMIIQSICFKLWKEYPQISLNLLKKIHTKNNVSFYDSRFRELKQFVDALNDFYGERLHFGVQSQVDGYPNLKFNEVYNSRYFYPIKGEILEDRRFNSDTYSFSPFQRMQIQHFFLKGGFALLEDATKNFCLAYQEIFNIYSFLNLYLDRQHFLNYFQHVLNMDFSQKLGEDEIKNAQKESIKTLIQSIDQFPFSSSQVKKERVAQIEMNIYLQCFRCNSLEKRIYGLQQFCDKIRTAQTNETVLFYIQDEWYRYDNILSFFQQNQIFKELFGEKAHFELIKRSFPILQFLYTNKCLSEDDILNIIKLGQGKHESWTNMISKLVSDLWEILSIEHIEAMLQHIKQKQIDHNDLNFIKSLGRNKSLVIQKENNEISLIRQPGKRKYQEDDYQNLQVGNIQIDETQNERAEILKSQIVEFLLNVVHDQPQNEIGQATFQVIISMICHQFKSLRQQYLIYCFEKLIDANPPLPINNYITLIEKIISSSYPIESFNNSKELVTWTQDNYDYKLNILKVIGRQKYKYLQGNLQQYLQVLEQLIKFYQFLHQNSKISAKQLQCLWKLFVECARCNEERDLFFKWLSDLNKKFLDQEAIEFSFFSIIKCQNLSVAMLQCLINLILYYNVQYKVMKLSYDQYTLQDSDIIGLQVIWKVFFAQQELVQKLQDFLIRLLKFKQSQQILNQLKKNYLIEIFQHIDNPATITLIIKLLEEFEGYRLVDQGDKVFVIIDNKCPDAMPPKRQDIQLFTNLSVLQTKQIIGQKLNPSLKSDEFDIFCRGTIFQDNKTLKDYKVNQKLTFTITKREIITDEMQAYNPPQLIPVEFIPIDAESKAQEVMMIVEIQDKDFILSVLKDKNWIVENAVGDLLDHGDQLQMEYQSKNQAAPPMNQQKTQQKQITDEVSFAQLISSEYIDQLFNLLNYGNAEQNQKIWSILQMIPRNKEVYKLIDQSLTDWTYFLMVDNAHKLQYHLQILKEQLQCDFIEDFDEYQKRHQLREHFLFYGGLNLLLQQLNNPIEIITIILDIFQIFLTAYALKRLPHKKDEYLQLQRIKQVALNKDEDCKICSLLILPIPKIEKPNIQGFDEAQLLEDVFMNHNLDIDWIALLDMLLQILGTEQVYATILSILYLKPELFTELPFQQLLQHLTNNNEEQRKMTAYFIMTIQDLGRRNDINYCTPFLKVLLNGQTQYDELSLVIAALIGQADDLSDLNTTQLASSIVEWIKQRDIIEERFLENEDKLLQGNLLLLTSIIQRDKQINLESDFAEFIYQCLFEMHNDYYKYPIYKRKLTRKRAFHLLLELCKQDKNLVIILQHLLQNHKLIIENGEQELDQGVKGSHGFVGLRNLGATCYINSLLQQFYMNKGFRNGILNGQIMITELQAPLIFDSVEKIDNILLQRKLQDHTLHQLQLVFIQLQESVKQYINPHQFIKTLKGFDGEQINILIQQDCNEFFNLLTDKLEKDQKHTNQDNLIPQLLGGTLINQMKSLESDCDFEREMEEPFLTVSIEVKHKKNLEEALDLYVKEDVLDGENKYFCEDVNRKIDVQKRYYFKKLPNTFIFHLKRFEFDYNTMLRIKINDYFEFPLEIDMFKWTRDNILDQKYIEDHTDYIYKLKGVVVHTGGAEGGHYYSFIRDEQNWFEFNDRCITPFKIENLKSECFGGVNTVSDWGVSTSKNAYMLFYDKIRTDLPMEIESNNASILQQQVIKQNTLYLKNQLFCAQEYLKFIQCFVQLKQVTQQFPLTQLLSQQYTSSIGGMEDLEQQSSLKIIKLFTNFIYETLQKNKDPQMFQYNIQILSDLYKSEPAANFWLLDFLCNQKQYVIDLLIESSQPDVRNSFAQLLIQAITIIVEHEQNYLNQESCLDRFFNFYFDSLFNLAKNNLRRSVEYFQVIKFSLINNQLLMKYFFEKQYFKTLFQLLQEQLSQCKEVNPFKLQQLCMNNIDQPLIQISDILVKVILSAKQDDSPMYLFKGQNHFQLDQFWVERLINFEELKKYLLPMIQFQPTIIDMIKHICWKNSVITEKVIQNIVSQMLNYFVDWQSLESLAQCIEALFKMEDGLEELRLSTLLSPLPRSLPLVKGVSLLEAIKQQFDSDKNYSYCLISILANLATVIPHVGECFKIYKQEYEFMLEKSREFKGICFGVMFPINKINKMITQLSLLFEEHVIQNFNEIMQQEPEVELDQDNQIGKLIDGNKANYSTNSNNEGSIGNHAPSSETEEV